MTDDERMRLGRAARDAWNEATTPEVVSPGIMPPMSWDDMPEWLQLAWCAVAEGVLVAATPPKPAAIVVRDAEDVYTGQVIVDAYECLGDAPDDDMLAVYEVVDWRWHPAAPAGEGES